MNPADVTRQLKTLAGVRMFEVYHVTSFKCYRRRKDDSVQEVTVEIWDAGPDHPRRYHCVAQAEDEKRASGNPDQSIEGVLATLNWWDLD